MLIRLFCKYRACKRKQEPKSTPNTCLCCIGDDLWPRESLLDVASLSKIMQIGSRGLITCPNSRATGQWLTSVIGACACASRPSSPQALSGSGFSGGWQAARGAADHCAPARAARRCSSIRLSSLRRTVSGPPPALQRTITCLSASKQPAIKTPHHKILCTKTQLENTSLPLPWCNNSEHAAKHKLSGPAEQRGPSGQALWTGDHALGNCHHPVRPWDNNVLGHLTSTRRPSSCGGGRGSMWAPGPSSRIEAETASGSCPLAVSGRAAASPARLSLASSAARRSCSPSAVAGLSNRGRLCKAHRMAYSV